MHLDSYQKSFSTGLFSPKESRKDLLWNVVEPGDPYDIRKFSFSDLDQPLLVFHMIKITLWARTSNLFVSSKQPKLNDLLTISMTTDSSIFLWSFRYK